MKKTTQFIDVTVIFIIGILLFTVGVNHQEIISFESRFYLFAREMWVNGPTWFPTTYNHPYPDYTAASTFLIYLCSKLFGGLNRFAAILPSAIASSVTLVITYLLGSLHSRRGGIAAVLFLMFTVTFVMEARSISLDQFVTAVTVGCFYIVYSAHLLEKPGRIFWIFPLFILGFIFRGPLGLVIPTGVVCVFYLLENQFKRFFLTGFIAFLLLLLSSGILFALAYHVGGDEFFHSVMQMELFGRMHDTKTVPFSFYFVESFGAYAISYPLAIFVLLGLLPNFSKTPQARFLRNLLGWALIVMIGLSIPADKKIRYILPVAPALALICGYLFSLTHQKYIVFFRKIFLTFCFLFPSLCLITLFFIHRHQPELNYLYISSLLVLIQLIAIIFIKKELTLFLLAVITFVSVVILVIEPINQHLNQTHEFVLQIEKIRKQQQGDLVFYNEGRDGIAIKYLVNMPAMQEPIFIDQPTQLSHLKGSAIIITKENNFKNIPNNNFYRIILHGKIGHDEVVVFMYGGYFHELFQRF